MTHVRLATVLLVLVALFAFGDRAPAHVKYVFKGSAERKQDEKLKNQKKDVQKAQKEIKNDAKDLSAAQQKLRQAHAKENEARHHLSEVRKRVEADHKSSLRIDEALAEQAQAQQALDDAKGPILQALKAKPEYQAAQDRVTAAKARAKMLRGDSSLSEEAQMKALAEAGRDALAVRDLEQSAIDAEPKLKPLRDDLGIAHDKVARLHAKLRDAVEADSEVQSSLRALQNVMRQTEQAKAAVAKENQELAGDQARLAKEQAQLSNAKLNDIKHVNTRRGRRPRTKKK